MVSEKKRPRKHRRFLAWAILILFVLICGSVIFTSIQGNQDPVTIRPTAAPGHTKTATPFSATPSATVAATLSPTLTPVLTPTALFTEDFNDNHNGWAVNTAEYIRDLSHQKLTLTVTNHNILTENIPVSTSLSDFTLSTTFTLEKADKHDKMGLYLRGDSNLDHDYRIDIYGNNVITINKEYLDTSNLSQSTELAHISGKDSVLRPIGQENFLVVEMDGPDITLWINGVMVNTLQDYDYTHGQAALFVNNGWSSDGATASFSSLDITSIPDPIPDVLPTTTVTPSATVTTTPASTTP
jgi:hypothetical protein